MKTYTRGRTKDVALLSSVAESIGSALGAIAAKANAAQKALSRNHALQIVERKARKLVRNSKRVARKTRKSAATRVRRNSLAKAARKNVRRATASAKRSARRR